MGKKGQALPMASPAAAAVILERSSFYLRVLMRPRPLPAPPSGHGRIDHPLSMTTTTAGPHGSVGHQIAALTASGVADITVVYLLDSVFDLAFSIGLDEDGRGRVVEPRLQQLRRLGSIFLHYLIQHSLYIRLYIGSVSYLDLVLTFSYHSLVLLRYSLLCWCGTALKVINNLRTYIPFWCKSVGELRLLSRVEVAKCCSKWLQESDLQQHKLLISTVIYPQKIVTVTKQHVTPHASDNSSKSTQQSIRNTTKILQLGATRQ